MNAVKTEQVATRDRTARQVVNQDRITARIQELAKIGKKEDGIFCLALSAEENEAHNLARTYMEEAGLTVRVDPAGNLIGRREGSDPDAPAVLVGSHLDTVYGGGAYDGRLGVVAGIEVAQRLNELGIKTKHPIEVYAYRDEEGTRFVGGYTGSLFVTGSQLAATLEHRDRDGITVQEALGACGIDPEHIGEATVPRSRIKAHLELHIEQGSVLENKNLAVGVVTGICCQIRGEITVKGQPAHAGTTPMALRKDALCAAAEIVLVIEEEAKNSNGCVATVGRITAEPGGVNVVPGTAKFSIDMRHLDPDVRNAMFDRICLRAQEICDRRQVSYTAKLLARDNTPKPCNDAVMDLIAESCAELGHPLCKLPSGAGHDSITFLSFCPAGMIFVRSKDGLSHNPAEYSSPEDCAAGADVLYRTVLKLAVEEE